MLQRHCQLSAHALLHMLMCNCLHMHQALRHSLDLQPAYQPSSRYRYQTISTAAALYTTHTLSGLWCQPAYKDLLAARPLLAVLRDTGLGINLWRAVVHVMHGFKHSIHGQQPRQKLTVRPSRLCVSLQARSAASSVSKVMNPNPRGLPVTLSRITICEGALAFGQDMLR